jgi:hypothetical protein
MCVFFRSRGRMLQEVLRNVRLEGGLWCLAGASKLQELVSVHQFTSDNNCSAEFDPFGCSVKDLPSQICPLEERSSGAIALGHSSPSGRQHLPFVAVFTSLWHQRLSHPGHEFLSKLARSSAICCNKSASHHLCHACQLCC